MSDSYKRPLQIFFSGCLLMLLSACSSIPHQTASLSQQELLSGTTLFGEQADNRALPEEDILGITDDMQQFLNNHVERHGSRSQRLRSLIIALHNNGLLNLEYTNDKTLTAGKTFQQRAGNCLAFTNLFIALAREVGLEATYQQVEVPPSWHHGGDFVVLNQHINVLVENPREPDYVVDFNLPDYNGGYDTEPVEDNAAFAQYYSNLGIEHLESGDIQRAFLHLKKALLTDARQAPIWTNLGALYSRMGHQKHAEAAYLYALKADSRNRSVHNNLAKLYRRQGRLELAEKYARVARRHRESNPYYHYSMAQQAYNAGQYQQTIEHLNDAIRKKDNEHLFYYLKGLSHYRLGNKKQARLYFMKAEEHSQREYLRQHYRNKLDLLASNGAT